jgi:hypothetical protein
MLRRNAIMKQATRSRASLLMSAAASKKPVSVVVSITPYKNSKGRAILQLTRTTYVVRDGGKYIYGLKARSPLHLLMGAPRAIRPKRRRA